MIQTEIQLTEAQIAALEDLASKRQVALTDLIHEAINKLLQAAAIEDAERRRKALAAVGRFKGPKDLARNHDKYLTEAFDS